MKPMSRRTFVASSASLLATGASMMILPRASALAGAASKSSTPAGATEHQHAAGDDMKQCIRNCQECHALCTQTIMHCLKLGGRHATPEFIRLLVDCAQLCETNIDYMLRDSTLHGRMCRICSDACRQCAQECEKVMGDDQLLKQCAEMCRRCGDSCDRMAKASA